ncbi:zinc ribbon domain-containing protein [Okeania sp. SIO2C2]|uniref:zinc ribbon domain-containing protein n=1 Tax=Okeania sp. SIO2C2 TaxID=2607787 RepID=UPI002579B8A1|nr:zinc ribbon domain-containing protein [Okeania sp. SIO2C2]
MRVISRWEPTSQTCSSCGFKGGKLDLQVREWECLNCGAKHDRDGNAAINILVAGGQSETLNGRGGKCKTTAKVAAASVSGALRQQNVNPQRSYGSVGIPASLGRGGCQ